jgi:hypothetical protein
LKLTILWKLVVAIVAPLLLLWVASIGLNYPRMRAVAVERMQAYLEKEAQFRAARLDGDFETMSGSIRSSTARASRSSPSRSIPRAGCWRRTRTAGR